jgi:hypothetical protein
MGATFSPASHLLEADEISLPYPLPSCDLEELSVINQWRQKLKGGQKDSRATSGFLRGGEKFSG